MIYKNNPIHFPVIEKDIPAGIYNKLPYWEETSWQNKNRKPWSEEEINAGLINHFGFSGMEPAQYKIILHEYDCTNKSYVLDKFGIKHNITDTEPDIKTTWILGKILKLGICAFSSDRFPAGAIATIGDWVLFDDRGTGERIRTLFEPIVIVDDTSIKMVLESPDEIING